MLLAILGVVSADSCLLPHGSASPSVADCRALCESTGCACAGSWQVLKQTPSGQHFCASPVGAHTYSYVTPQGAAYRSLEDVTPPFAGCSSLHPNGSYPFCGGTCYSRPNGGAWGVLAFFPAVGVRASGSVEDSDGNQYTLAGSTYTTESCSGSCSAGDQCSCVRTVAGSPHEPHTECVGFGKCGGDYRFRAQQPGFLDGSGDYVYHVGGVTRDTASSLCGMSAGLGRVQFEGVVDGATEVVIAIDDCNQGAYGAPTINGVALQPSDKIASDTSMSPQCHGGAHPDRVDFWRGNVASGDTIICTATCQPLGVFFKVQT